MTTPFDDEEENAIVEQEEIAQDTYQASSAHLRRRLELLLAEKKLRDELEDLFDE